MALRARKVFGTFEQRVPGLKFSGLRYYTSNIDKRNTARVTHFKLYPYMMYTFPGCVMTNT